MSCSKCRRYQSPEMHSCQPAKTKSRDICKKKWDLWVKSRDIYIIRSIHFHNGHYNSQRPLENNRNPQVFGGTALKKMGLSL